MIEIKDASLNDIPDIQAIVEETWWPTYKNLLSTGQIRYMLDTLYSSSNLAMLMQQGLQKFVLTTENGTPIGFAAYGLREDDESVCKLHKLYVLPSHQGKGLGKLLIEEIKQRLSPSGIKTLDLNVKRDNPAKLFYEKLGFKVIGEEDIPLGPYWLNDFVMRLTF